MKRKINIFADVAANGGSLLLEVALGLREHRLQPESLIWALLGGNKIKLLLVIAPRLDHHLCDLVERFQRVPGVFKVEIENPPELGASPIIMD